jgi:hypothetical protein
MCKQKIVRVLEAVKEVESINHPGKDYAKFLTLFLWIQRAVISLEQDGIDEKMSFIHGSTI